MARVASAALAAIVLLALAGPSSAATITQKIYGDLADNGRLDGHYTRAQINRALHAPSLQGYERPARPVVPRPEIASSGPSRPGDAHRPLPFSGLDLALFGGVGGPLLLLGASLGRLARVRSDGELSR
ncbi:MAG: hypothetical protein E6G45_02930 [Actinobacteria bacterium]|nr:MAG: hypothetical protein E6G45_02930 [Actinomycetota bacterium]